MARALVNRILPVSVVDGPGNRTAVFLQGCNIACAYCHNPETQQICRGCGACVAACPAGALTLVDGKVAWDSTKCAQCDTCIKLCPHFASPKVRDMEAAEVFEAIRPNLPFIRGVTVSGGECSLRPDFLREFFTLVRAEGRTCLMDSNGQVDLAALPELMAVCDGVMLDVKSWDEETHRRLTGAGNDAVKRNLRFLDKAGKLEEVRVVCIPPEVDAEAAVDGIAASLRDPARIRLKLIKFRPFGVRGLLAQRTAPADEYMEGLRRRALAAGFTTVVVT